MSSLSLSIAALPSEQTIKQEIADSHAQSTATVREAITNVERQLQTIHTENKHSEAWSRFLDSLVFPEILARQHSIKVPHCGTADWVFSMPPQPPNRRWDDFDAWLKQPQESTYWICGKAASGKSILMAHISSDTRTREGLQQWSHPHELHLISYFFWRPGTDMQRNFSGLLRSILLQLLLVPSVAQSYQQAHMITMSQLSWSERRLLATIEAVLSIKAGIYFCLFIDGLDEFDDDPDDLINMIERIQTSKNVKLCVSSRPEVELVSRLECCQQLRMEHYNYEAIETYTRAKLEEGHKISMAVELSDLRSIASRIAQDANGMFLWAVLVVRSVLRRLRSQDDMAALKARLDSTPKEMDALMLSMLNAIDKAHMPSVLFHFQPLRAFSETADFLAVDVLTAATQPRSLRAGYSDFKDACERTMARITAQTAGLLELDDKTYLSSIDERFNGFFAVPSLSLRNSPHFQRSSCRVLIDRRHEHVYLVKYSYITPTWVHRSAFDTICAADASVLKSEHSLVPDIQDTITQCFEAALRVIAYAPSVLKRWAPEGTPHRATSMISALYRCDGTHATVRTMMERLLDLVTSFHALEMIDYHDYFTTAKPSTAFVLLCISLKCLTNKHISVWHDSIDRLTSMVAEDTPVDAFTSLLHLSVLILSVGRHWQSFSSHRDRERQPTWTAFFRILEASRAAVDLTSLPVKRLPAVVYVGFGWSYGVREIGISALVTRHLHDALQAQYPDAMSRNRMTEILDMIALSAHFHSDLVHDVPDAQIEQWKQQHAMMASAFNVYVGPNIQRSPRRYRLFIHVPLAASEWWNGLHDPWEKSSQEPPFGYMRLRICCMPRAQIIRRSRIRQVTEIFSFKTSCDACMKIAKQLIAAKNITRQLLCAGKNIDNASDTFEPLLQHYLQAENI